MDCEESERRVERRKNRWRRQFNDAFLDEDGHVIVSKFIATTTQIMVFFHTTFYFRELVARWEALLICLGVLIAPDVVKKAINLKFGNHSSMSP